MTEDLSKEEINKIKEQKLKDLEDGKNEYYKRQDEKKKAGIIEAEELSEKDKKYYKKNISHGPIPEFEYVNGNGKTKNQQQISIQDIIFDKLVDEDLIKSEIQSNDYVEYIIKQIKKTVKCEDILIRQILYTALSSYIGFDPINLGIIAPTSEGKTYPVEECIRLFPKHDVEKVGSMSAKVLVRKRGILVDKNLNPIGDELKELYKQRNSIKDPE